MADMSAKIAEVGQPGILTVIAVLFLLVFGIKGALFPLYFWLPGSYSAPPMPVLALFGALLTKVGLYAITRTYTLFFIHDISFTHELLLVLSVLTVIMGCIGALAYFDLKQIIIRSEEHTSELQSRGHLVCRLLLEKKKKSYA